MDNWLKALIATACIVVIAGGAHYGYERFGEQQARQAAREAARHDALVESQQERRRAEQAKLDYCHTRVPSQATDELKQLFAQCMEKW